MSDRHVPLEWRVRIRETTESGVWSWWDGRDPAGPAPSLCAVFAEDCFEIAPPSRGVSFSLCPSHSPRSTGPSFSALVHELYCRMCGAAVHSPLDARGLLQRENTESWCWLNYLGWERLSQGQSLCAYQGRRVRLEVKGHFILPGGSVHLIFKTSMIRSYIVYSATLEFRQSVRS